MTMLPLGRLSYDDVGKLFRVKEMKFAEDDDMEYALFPMRD